MGNCSCGDVLLHLLRSSFMRDFELVSFLLNHVEKLIRHFRRDSKRVLLLLLHRGVLRVTAHLANLAAGG